MKPRGLEVLLIRTGLIDIEGFSHLFVLWEFHRSRTSIWSACRLLRSTPRGLCHPISPPAQPDWSYCCGFAPSGERLLHVRGVDMLDGTPILESSPICQAFPRSFTPRMAGGSGAASEMMRAE